MGSKNRRRVSQRHSKKCMDAKVWMLIGVAAAGILLGGATGQAMGAAPNFLLVSHSEIPTIRVQERPTPPPMGNFSPKETPTPSETPPGEETPGTEEEWNLLLVNPWNALPEGYAVELTQLKNGQAVDSRCYADLQAMVDACRAEGLSPVICSSFRTREKQERLYNNQVDKLAARGYSKSEAEKEAGKSVALPGTSEHELGLAVDIVDLNNQNLNESQENTPVQKWLMEHCWEYGFILRYPQGKSDLTGIIYEPWHYRYVGSQAAQAMREEGVCLEEYQSE